MIKEVEAILTELVRVSYGVDMPKVSVTRPDPAFGDIATNIAMQLAGRLHKQPREIAAELATKLEGNDIFTAVQIAGPGFLNLRVSDVFLLNYLVPDAPKLYDGQRIVTEYSDPNPFKVLHVGHIYTSFVGQAISNLLDEAGASVVRVNYGGDVGLHVGRTMWAILESLGGEFPDKLGDIPTDERADWMTARYVEGTAAYDDDSDAKAAIVTLNKQVYGFHASGDHESPLARIYWTCRDWSYAYFDMFYERIGTPFDKYYPESAIAMAGLQVVRDQIGKVFEESEGAVVFKGEPYGLHTRVFINREGLPTYETKDIGLVQAKYDDYHFDRSIVITGSEQQHYMAVVLKALEQFKPDLVKATTHVTHGLVKMVGGVKMSSRKGNTLRAVQVLEAASTANEQANGAEDPRVSLGAIKYSLLKQRLGPDIIYDPKESVSLHGNSGPYLQYAHARARSILAKAGAVAPDTDASFDAAERSLAVKLSEYGEVLQRAIEELAPHHICTYLYELSQEFNRFYEASRVVGDPREAIRLRLIARYADVLHHGLKLLGIDAPDRL